MQKFTDCLRLKLKKVYKKIIKPIQYKAFEVKKKYIFKELRNMVPNLEVENLKRFAKWIAERDSTSVTFKCSHCGFEYTDADPEAKCEYKGCPMCMAVIDGITEETTVICPESDNSWQSAVMRTFLGGDGK